MKCCTLSLSLFSSPHHACAIAGFQNYRSSPFKKMSDALINGLAGARGGIIAQLITYSLQTVIYFWLTHANKQIESLTRKHGTVHQMIQGVYYYFYQIFRAKAEAAAIKRLKKGTGDGTVGMFSSLLVAAISGCVNVLITSPIWVVVTRMQTHRKALKEKPSQNLSVASEEDAQITAPEPRPFGTSHSVQDVYDEGGITGFWRGAFPTLVMVSKPSIQFMLYETLLKKLKAKRASRQETMEYLLWRFSFLEPWPNLELLL